MCSWRSALFAVPCIPRSIARLAVLKPYARNASSRCVFSKSMVAACWRAEESNVSRLSVVSHVQVQTSSSPPGRALCPYCKHSPFSVKVRALSIFSQMSRSRMYVLCTPVNFAVSVQFLGPRAQDEKLKDKAEQQRLAEARRRSSLVSLKA